MYAVAHMEVRGQFCEVGSRFHLYVRSKDQTHEAIQLARQAFLYSETSHCLTGFIFYGLTWSGHFT